MDLPVFDISGNKKEAFRLDYTPITRIGKQAIFDQIMSEYASNRQGTHSTLTKAEVRGGGRKPRPQKHSGRSRQGSIRNPQWRGGGVCFGPKPTRNYRLKTNYKISQFAYASMINIKTIVNGIGIIEDTDINTPKTKNIYTFIKKIIPYIFDAQEFANAHRKTYNILIAVDNNINADNFIKSCRNLKITNIKIPNFSADLICQIIGKKYHQVSVKDLANADYVFVQKNILHEFMKGERK